MSKLRLKAKFEDDGRGEVMLNDLDISDRLVGLSVKVQVGEPTLVHLDLILVEGELDLASIKLDGASQGETDDE